MSVPRHSTSQSCFVEGVTDLRHLWEEADGQGEGQAKGSKAHKALHGKQHPGSAPQESCPARRRRGQESGQEGAEQVRHNHLCHQVCRWAVDSVTLPAKGEATVPARVWLSTEPGWLELD